jgi:hypothetical protein
MYNRIKGLRTAKTSLLDIVSCKNKKPAIDVVVGARKVRMTTSDNDKYLRE